MAKRRRFPSDHRPWFRLTEDILDDPKISEIDDAAFRLFINLLAALSRANSKDGSISLSRRSICALARRERVVHAEATMRRLGDVSLTSLRRLGDVYLVEVSNWSKLQGFAPTIRIEENRVEALSTRESATPPIDPSGSPDTEMLEPMDPRLREALIESDRRLAAALAEKLDREILGDRAHPDETLYQDLHQSRVGRKIVDLDLADYDPPSIRETDHDLEGFVPIPDPEGKSPRDLEVRPRSTISSSPDGIIPSAGALSAVDGQWLFAMLAKLGTISESGQTLEDWIDENYELIVCEVAALGLETDRQNFAKIRALAHRYWRRDLNPRPGATRAKSFAEIDRESNSAEAIAKARRDRDD